jgi:hypothetical protein
MTGFDILPLLKGMFSQKTTAAPSKRWIIAGSKSNEISLVNLCMLDNEMLSPGLGIGEAFGGTEYPIGVKTKRRRIAGASLLPYIFPLDSNS